jgi:hypothetical protein
MSTTRQIEWLAEAGQMLFGQHWNSPLSDAINVHIRTVRRWANGTADMPPGAWEDIADLLDKLSADANLMADKIIASLRA